MKQTEAVKTKDEIKSMRLCESRDIGVYDTCILECKIATPHRILINHYSTIGYQEHDKKTPSHFSGIEDLEQPNT